MNESLATVQRILSEFETAGSVRFALQASASSNGNVPAPLVVKPKHARRLSRVAACLECDPKQFLDWQLDDAVDELEDPDGTREQWMHELLIYETPESERRVKARYEQWHAMHNADGPGLALLDPLLRSMRTPGD